MKDLINDLNLASKLEYDMQPLTMKTGVQFTRPLLTIMTPAGFALKMTARVRIAYCETDYERA